MKKVFLCGPITGLEQHNMAAFQEARSKVYVQNVACYAPPLMLKVIDIERRETKYMKDVTRLMIDSDMVVTMNDWHLCPLAIKQVNIARQLGMEVVHISTFPKQCDSHAPKTIVSTYPDGVCISSEIFLSEEKGGTS
jgi:hypothetical protein